MFRGLAAEAGFFLRTFTDVVLGVVAMVLVTVALAIVVPAAATARSSGSTPNAAPTDPSDRPPTTVTFLYEPPLRLLCGAIDLVYDPTGEPYAAAADISAAGRRLEAVTGRRVSVRTEEPSALGPPIAVTIGWAPDLDEYGSDVAGIGSPFILGDHLTGGSVELDAAAQRGKDRPPIGPILDHELGHALFGLDHSQRPTDLMFPSITSTSAFSTDETLALGWVANDPGCSLPKARSAIQ